MGVQTRRIWHPPLVRRVPMQMEMSNTELVEPDRSTLSKHSVFYCGRSLCSFFLIFYRGFMALMVFALRGVSTWDALHAIWVERLNIIL